MSESPNLLELLGLDEETLTWRHLAFCRSMLPVPDESGDPQDLFFEAYEADEEIAKAMDEVCLSCPVFRDCFVDAAEQKDYGLRAAIYLSNGKQDKQHNKHKTPEVWARIQERLR